MGYIQELRRLVGHRPLLMPGAVVLVLDAMGRLLLHRRRDNGHWGPPGGAMEPGERPEETARRELREETGLEAGELELLGVFSGPELFYRYPNGDQVYNVVVAYVARAGRGDLQVSGEGTDLRFFPLDGLPAEISPPDRPILERFLEVTRG